MQRLEGISGITTMRTLIPCLLVLATVANESDIKEADNRAMIGVEMTPPSSQTQTVNGLDPNVGVEVQQVYSGTSAEKMGLQPGDVITGINGSPISSMTDLRNEVALAGVGAPVQLEVARNGTRVTTNGNLGEWPSHIPYQPIDSAAERRFRDWQSRRLDRMQEAVASLGKQVDNLRRSVDGAADKPVTRIENPAMALGMPAGDALAALPAWRIRVNLREDTPNPTSVRTDPPQTAVDNAWRVRFLGGTTKTEIY
jgi:membrane-associated protease RseP (regulator of RpoE activity)